MSNLMIAALIGGGVYVAWKMGWIPGQERNLLGQPTSQWGSSFGQKFLSGEYVGHEDLHPYGWGWPSIPPSVNPWPEYQATL